MSRPGAFRLTDLSSAIRATLSRLEVLALFPALALAGVWFGNQDLLTVSAFLLPALLAVQAIGGGRGAGLRDRVGPLDGLTGLPGRKGLLAMLDRAAEAAPQRTSACILLQIDDMDGVSERWGTEGTEEILRRSAERLRSSMRDADMVARLGDALFGVVLHPVRSARLDALTSIVDRLQADLAEPVAIGGSSAHVTASVGFATLADAEGGSARLVLEAAESALGEARRNGPGSVRAYSADIARVRRRRTDLALEVEGAFAEGQIRAWFQPQVSTDTGTITGFEALARWHHPEAGVLAPGEFLTAIDDAGLMSRLGETMMFHALTALQSWDKAGLAVPSVAVNFSAEELRDPSLADRVKWEVDRFDLRPGRLTVEILETVAARSDDDVIVRNIQLLGSHGFNLDLDDFGTGQASIANIRRFHVNRIKIDRSFVSGVDTDPAQQSMVSAILSLADHLGVDTLAEGVETVGEHAMLAQLGCSHVQGFVLARPMQFEDTIAWMRGHNQKLVRAPGIGGRQVG